MIALTGCSQRLGDFTIISTKNVDIGKNYVKVQTQEKGISSKAIIIFIPTGTPNIKDAVDDLLKKANGDLVTNAVIQYSWYYIPYIYGEYKYEITGDVYKKVETALNELKNKPLSENAQTDVDESSLFFTAEQVNGQVQLTQVNQKDVAVNTKTQEIIIKK